MLLCKLKGAGHCTSAKRMTSLLRHVAEPFPPARQGTILNSHRAFGIATNTSMVLVINPYIYCCQIQLILLARLSPISHSISPGLVFTFKTTSGYYNSINEDVSPRLGELFKTRKHCLDFEFALYCVGPSTL